MATKDVLKKIEGKYDAYLKTLADTSKSAGKEGLTSIVKESDSMARGYIRCLVDCGAIERNEFRVLMSWYNIISS